MLPNTWRATAERKPPGLSLWEFAQTCAPGTQGLRRKIGPMLKLGA
jgi:hypothetical protein